METGRNSRLLASVITVFLLGFIVIYFIWSNRIFMQNIPTTTLASDWPSQKRGAAWSAGAGGGVATDEVVFGLSPWVYRHWYNPELCVEYQSRYVPLVQGKWQNDIISQIEDTDCNVDYWLVWNEPDLTAHDDIAPAQAPALYKALVEDVIKVKYPQAKIIFAGLSQLAFPTNQNDWWLKKFADEFFKQYSRYPQVDGIHVHFYPDAAGLTGSERYNAAAVLNFLQKIRNFMDSPGQPWLNNKELWLTEIGLNCDFVSCPEATVNQYLKNLISALDDNSDIARYAWYPAENTEWPPGQMQNYAALLINGVETIYGTTWRTYGIYPTIIPTVTFTPTPSTHCQPLGDIDCSGKVNALDLSILLSKFGTADATADLDDSGKVNALDFSILLSNFGRSS